MCRSHASTCYGLGCSSLIFIHITYIMTTLMKEYIKNSSTNDLKYSRMCIDNFLPNFKKWSCVPTTGVTCTRFLHYQTKSTQLFQVSYVVYIHRPISVSSHFVFSVMELPSLNVSLVKYIKRVSNKRGRKLVRIEFHSISGFLPKRVLISLMIRI